MRQESGRPGCPAIGCIPWVQPARHTMRLPFALAAAVAVLAVVGHAEQGAETDAFMADDEWNEKMIDELTKEVGGGWYTRPSSVTRARGRPSSPHPRDPARPFF